MSKIPLPPPTAMPLPPATGNVPPPPPKVIEGEFIPAMIKAPPPPTRAEPELITPELITNNNAPIAGGEFTRVKKANPHELVLVNGRLCVTNLHDYQVRTVNHQLRCIDSMLWLGLGLGKTVSTLTTIVERMRRGTLKRTLIVAPLRVCQLTWKHEADTWDHTKHLTFANMFGSAKDRQRALFSQKDIYLINFESLGWLALQLTEYFINQGLDLPFEMIVFDEISKMKRPESQRFKDFAPVIPFFKSHTGLTASPASNGLHNMWGQYYVIDQGKRLGENYNTFKNRFFYQAEGTRGKTIEHDDSRELLIERVSDITIEIPAEGNIELPDFQEIDVMVKLTPKLMRDYLTLEEEFVLGLENGDELEVFNAASLANKLLQFSSGVVYNVPDPELRPDYRVEQKIHKIKDAALDDIIEESGDEPIMLAYNFSSERDRIMKKYKDARCLTGVEESEAVEIMEKFNKGEIKLLLVHPLSAGYGLNLQKACSTIVWYGLGYNLEAYEQTVGRIYRQGNKSTNVRCLRILMADTMDMAVSAALESKDVVQSNLKEHMREFANRSH